LTAVTAEDFVFKKA